LDGQLILADHCSRPFLTSIAKETPMFITRSTSFRRSRRELAGTSDLPGEGMHERARRSRQLQPIHLLLLR
jgi:hypothetical protein